jgi:thiol-disulfide isomerase/thioredoxin
MRSFAILTVAAALGLSGPALVASEAVDELLESVAEEVPEDVRSEPGNTTWQETLSEYAAELDALGLEEADQQLFRLAVAEAWLAADDGDQAQELALAVLADDKSAELRERAGLALVAAWRKQLEAAVDDEERAALGDPIERLAEHGEFPAVVQARAQTVAGLQQALADEPEAAFAFYDAALALVEEAPPRERVPIFELRLLAMEHAKMDAKAVLAWFTARKRDPAVEMVLATLLTASQQLVGREAPPLEAPRLDGEAGRLSVADFKGKPVLVYFFSTWARSCAITDPAVAAFAKEHAGNVAVIGVSIDTKDTVANLPAWVAANGGYPIIGEQLGWDTEMDDAYHVEAIPHLVMIDAEGSVTSTDLVGDTTEETGDLLATALSDMADADADIFDE